MVIVIVSTAVEEQGKIIKHVNIKLPATNKISTFAALLNKLQPLQRVTVCSVHSEEVNQQFSQLCIAQKAKSVYFLRPNVNSFAINLAYEDPSQLGADRLSVMLAVAEKYSGRSCIVDCGTAVTVDVLEANRQHRGGVIFPGLQSMQQTLSVTTEIKHPIFGDSNNLLANTTQDGIYAGCLSAVVGGIEYIVNTMQEIYDSFDQLIITGGDAQQLIPMLKSDLKYEPTLVLDGLLFVAKKLYIED